MRTREIAPGFFRNEQLGELPPLARIMFAGLWCLADREGRIEDRPEKIRAEVLPFDAVKGGPLIAALADAGLIVRYVANGVRCIQVTNFAKFQHPHQRERPSSLPPMEPGQAPGKPQASPRQAQDSPPPFPSALSALSALSSTTPLTPLRAEGGNRRIRSMSAADLLAEMESIRRRCYPDAIMGRDAKRMDDLRAAFSALPEEEQAEAEQLNAQPPGASGGEAK